MKTIRLSKKITISSSTTDVNQKELYTTLLAEIKQLYNPSNAQGSTWSIHKEKKSPFFNKTNGLIANFANSLVQSNKKIALDIKSRQDFKIVLNLFNVLIDEYDFNDAKIDLLFQSEQFELLETFGHLILIKQNIENSIPFLVDLNDDNISISEYVITE